MFAIGIFALGVVALGELYTLMARVRPVNLGGFLALGGMIAAALYGDPRARAAGHRGRVPARVLALVLPPAARARFLGARRHLLRRPLGRDPDGARRVPARRAARRRADGGRADRDLPRRHRGVLRRAPLRPPAARAADLAEQDRRGPRGGGARRDARPLVRRPLPGLADRLRRRRDRPGRGARGACGRPVRVAREARSRGQGHGSFFGAHGGVSTASMPCSSRWSPATTRRRRWATLERPCVAGT